MKPSISPLLRAESCCITVYGVSWKIEHKLPRMPQTKSQGGLIAFIRKKYNLTIAKCDGARPGCSRCARHGVKCSGYPEKFSFREYKPQQKHETPACALSQRPDNSVLRARSRSSGSLQEPPFATSKIPSKGLSECPDWQSLCNFMNRIVIQVHRSPCSGHLAFMPDLFREKGAAPHLKHAILSVSHLTIFNDTGHREFYWRARKNHGLALGHLNKALGSHENAVKDETLAACLLMSMFYVRTEDALFFSCSSCLC